MAKCLITENLHIHFLKYKSIGFSIKVFQFKLMDIDTYYRNYYDESHLTIIGPLYYYITDFKEIYMSYS